MGTADLLQMAAMGLVTSAAAPLLVLLTRTQWRWQPLSWPAPVALAFFVLLHGSLTVGMDIAKPGPLVHGVLAVLLLAGAVIFWLPVLGPARPLDAAGRSVYLFLAAPSLDLAAVIVVARGDSAGGLAMIVAMLPIGVVALVLTWRWLRADEAAARVLDAAERPQEDWVIGEADGWVPAEH